ncbi:MAG: Gfo/Idh/MocA family protein [Sphingomicrobium sp.]
MAEPVRWGVLGTAKIAVERTIPAIAEVAHAQCLAIASRDAARAEASARGLGVECAYGDYGDLLTDDDVEAVYIPLPNQLHVEWCERALKAGKAVLCEKPLCLTACDVERLIEVRNSTGGLIEEALVFRNHPQWVLIEDILKGGRIGAPLAVQGTIAKRFLDPADIRNQPGLGGGAAYDLGTYVIAACNLVFGRAPVRVCATLDVDPEFKIDRLTTALLDYGGAHASFTASSQGATSAWATHQQFSVLGSNGWLRANFPYAQARPTACSVHIGDQTSVGAFPTEIHDFPPVNQYALQVERFSALVRGEAVRHWPIEDSLVTLRIIEAMFRSARESRWIGLN